MTPNQEDALFNFLDKVTEPFTLDDITEFIRLMHPQRIDNLSAEIALLLDSRKMAFKVDNQKWLSRRGFFEDIVFVISPTKLELLNGILIPGHRCIPFANPGLLPHEYFFYWKGKKIKGTTTEGPPEEFYPYYCIYGEEYAPQYVAQDNSENELAFNSDPFEEPPEVSIHTLDMRAIYREAAFIPGDSFLVRTKDWIEGSFYLEKADKSTWTHDSLSEWKEAAEDGFKKSFSLLGPGDSTEEQIVYSYWYGSKRMREIPAYSIEEFLYEITDQVETINYGIESRFWLTGKDIPDCKGLGTLFMPPDMTIIEDILFNVNIPVSEYIILSYVRDALYRNDADVNNIINRIVPPVIRLAKKDWDLLADFVSEALEEYSHSYSIFPDKNMGPIRQRAVELHSAVIEIAAQLLKRETDSSWLPRHTFIVLSQIQIHVGSLLVDLDTDESPPDAELNVMDNSLDSMIDALDEIKESIKDAMNNYRRNNLSLVHPGKDKALVETWRTVQISISDTNIWRKALIPMRYTLNDLHRIIQISLNWKDSYRHYFYIENTDNLDRKILDEKINLQAFWDQGIKKILYVYGNKWNVEITILLSHKVNKKEVVQCISGEGTAPPEDISGPSRFNKILKAIESGGEKEKKAAMLEIGSGFVPGVFDIEACNQNLLNECR
ncbi:MAG: plasmid pRiA4b ORF-3 family protein [Treponema sp.]|nr:plasmid pRiA4b ORF-3 family protein [Treponema sp.]